MTAQRQEENGRACGIRFRPAIAAILVAAGLLQATLDGLAGLAGIGGLAGTAGVVAAARAATTERVVANRYSGLAIEGFDPVAYFVDGQPLVGSVEFEAFQAGVTWRFRNEGNRASFVAHPDIYGPQFGGYDPIDLARGVTVAGNPRFWLVSGDRLYLFAFEAHRDAYAADPGHFLPVATSRWPGLEQGLAQ